METVTTVAIEKIWKTKLENEFKASYFTSLKSFLLQEREQFIIFPPGASIFAAFNNTPFDAVKVVLIGQDPYHRKGQANGLSFSVGPNVPKPPSLVNIFKELKGDLGFQIPQKGGLESWAAQGVLLLNATLTVREGQPGSHHGKGWEKFTDAVIKKISDEKKGVVFLLWGRFAHTKEGLINSDKHFILKAAHPSPLARGAFFGSRHFSKTNRILESQGIQPINWEIKE